MSRKKSGRKRRQYSDELKEEADVSGAFREIVTEPAFQLGTSHLYTTGEVTLISIHAIPEPSTVVMLLVAGLSLLLIPHRGNCWVERKLR